MKGLILFLWAVYVLEGQTGGSFAGEYRGSNMLVKVRPEGADYIGSIQFPGESMPFHATVADGKLQGRFQSQGGQFPFELRRDGAGYVLATAGEEYRLEGVPAESVNPLARNAELKAADKGLVGSWRHATGTLTFDGSGTGMSNGSAFRYKVEGNTLLLTDDQASLRFTHAVEGNTLRLTGTSGVQLVLTRSAASEPSGDLSGKWCYVGNVNATGGGARATNQCFTLHPDGRYEYYGETDSYGANGGATSQGSDRGTVTTSGNTLTARSDSGRVTNFRLERRNHPKTNDPMLVLDGQTFVTFHQKAPWRF